MASDLPVAIPCVDWSTVSEEILCPLCDYNLRGLIQPRCPECGSHYLWDDLLDPRRRKHPYLFEHHPEMNWNSFWRTAKGGLRPINFWRSLHPVQPSNRWRLVLYTLIVWISVYLLLTLGGFVSGVVGHYRQITYYWPGYATKLDTLDGAFRRTITAYPTFLAGPYRLPTFLILGWPVATLMTLMIFRASMRRAKARTIHVARCVVYSADAILWLGLITALLRPNQLLLTLSPLFFYVTAVTLAVLRVLSFTMPQGMRRGRLLRPVLLTADLILFTALYASIRSLLIAQFDSSGSFAVSFHGDVPALLALACLIFGTVKLIAAYKIYLQFDHPIATVLASQVMVALVILNVGLSLTLY